MREKALGNFTQDGQTTKTCDEKVAQAVNRFEFNKRAHSLAGLESSERYFFYPMPGISNDEARGVKNGEIIMKGHVNLSLWFLDLLIRVPNTSAVSPELLRRVYQDSLDGIVKGVAQQIEAVTALESNGLQDTVRYYEF